MHRICEYIDDELKELERKVAGGQKLNASEIEYGDLLAHFKKSLLTNEAMEEAYEDGYSEEYRGGSYEGRGGRGGSSRGGSYRGNSREEGMSYARGRGRNARRDSMGRYSREQGRYSREGRYSYDDAKDDMVSELRELMENAPDEKTRQEFNRFIEKMENM